METVAFFGTDGGVSFARNGFGNALNRIGHNTGNMLFQRAMWDLVKGPKMCVGNGEITPELINEIADVLVIPAANQINPAFNMSNWVDFFKKIELPYVVVGLGAQSDDPLLAPEELVLPDKTKEFAKLISSRTDAIGVRGEYTKRVLASIGIENTLVTGCPSQTLNMNVTGQEIASLLEKAKSNKKLKIALLGGTLQERTRKVEKILYDSVRNAANHICVYQTDPNVLRFLHEKYIDEKGKNFLDWMGGVVRPDLGSKKFLDYIAARGTFYSDTRSWIDAMSRRDLAIGMRIHGAVAAIQAGKLGVCVAFDSRTLELSATMGIPYVEASLIENGMSVNDILELVTFDVDGFEGKRHKNISAINSIIDPINNP